MTATIVELPRKTRELQNHHMDSTLWNDFPFRDDDIIVATYGKAGTTWTQQIVAQLVFGADPSVPIHEISLWWDMRIVPPQARQAVFAQDHRRILKTHLPADALVMSDKAKYIYVARDGRDVLWSMYNHHAGFRDEAYEYFNGPGLVGEPLPRPDPDIRDYFRTWLERDGYPFWSFWENTATWWALRNQPNVKLIHFNALKADLEGQMRSIAAFLDLDLPQAKWPDAVRHCTFDYMKANAERFAPGGGAIWQGGADTFIHKGVNGRWKDVLSADSSQAYESMAIEKLGADCARWLLTGEGG
jgi:aryl sulfotransferase